MTFPCRNGKQHKNTLTRGGKRRHGKPFSISADCENMEIDNDIYFNTEDTGQFDNTVICSMSADCEKREIDNDIFQHREFWTV